MNVKDFLKKTGREFQTCQIATGTRPEDISFPRLKCGSAIEGKIFLLKARWQNGDVEDCKSFNAGSIPARASKNLMQHVF